MVSTTLQVGNFVILYTASCMLVSAETAIKCNLVARLQELYHVKLSILERQSGEQVRRLAETVVLKNLL